MKKSKYVKEQRYLESISNREKDKMVRYVNRQNKIIENLGKQFDKSMNESVKKLFAEGNLLNEDIPVNSRIYIYNILEKSLNDKLKQYNSYLENKNNDEEKINEINKSIEKCNKELEQIENIYSLGYIKKINLVLLPSVDNLFKDALFKLGESELKFYPITDLEKILTAKFDNVDKAKDLLNKLCYFILNNDLEEYYTFISNTIINFSIFNSDDPIVDLLIKSLETE